MRVVLTAALVLASLTGATWPAMAASTWRSWTVNDGLYESYSKLVIPTSDGLVWIRHGLAERVSVFDGFDITVAEGTDLGDVSVAGRDGSLWSWHLRANELRWTRDDRIERFAIPLHPETQKKQRLVGFEAVETGGVLVLTTARVYFFRQSIAESEVMLTAGDGLIGGFLALAKDLEGRVWVTGDHGVARFGWTGSADKMQLQRVWRHESFPGCVGAEKFYALTVGRDGEAFVTVRRSNDFAIYHFVMA